MKVIERYPAGKLPKELLGDDIPPDAMVRVIIQTTREPDVDALMRAVTEAGEQAERNGLTEEMLDQLIEEARGDNDLLTLGAYGNIQIVTPAEFLRREAAQ